MARSRIVGVLAEKLFELCRERGWNISYRLHPKSEANWDSIGEDKPYATRKEEENE